MLMTDAGKVLLAASAVAGLAFLAQPAPSIAASSTFCQGYARDMAARNVSRGTADYDRLYRSAYDAAYDACRDMRGVRIGPTAAEPEASSESGANGKCPEFGPYTDKYQPNPSQRC